MAILLLNKLVNHLQERIQDCTGQTIQDYSITFDELTVEIHPSILLPVCLILRDTPDLHFDMLLDICGVDYRDYGIGEWETEKSTESGFSRAIDSSRQKKVNEWSKPRFAAVYHLLSLKYNQRLRLRSFTQGEPPGLDSIISVWPSANWYEREAFDLYGIFFHGHPDLRRILTDYGFVGHPFRKDFPLSGHQEVRYDAKTQSVIYDTLNIEERAWVPKTIRELPSEESLEEKPDGA